MPQKYQSTKLQIEYIRMKPHIDGSVVNCKATASHVQSYFNFCLLKTVIIINNCTSLIRATKIL